MQSRLDRCLALFRLAVFDLRCAQFEKCERIVRIKLEFLSKFSLGGFQLGGLEVFRSKFLMQARLIGASEWQPGIR